MTNWYHRKLDLSYDPVIFEEIIEYAEHSLAI